MNARLATYRSVERASFGSIRAILAIMRANLRVIWRYWFFWIIIGLSLLHFLIMFALIYLKSQIGAAENMGMVSMIFDQIQITGSGAAYRDFLLRQSETVVVLLAYVATVLLATDFQAGGINFYLSRPIGRLHYLAGKMLALMAIVGAITWLPAIGLFLESALYSNSFEYVRDHNVILVSITGYSLLIMTIPSVAALAISAVFRKTPAIIVAWLGLFLLVPAFANLLRAVFNERKWLLLSLHFDFFVMADALFGSDSTFRLEMLPYAVIAAMTVMVFSIAIVLRRLQPVEVVS